MSTTDQTNLEATIDAEAFDNYLAALDALVDEARVHIGQYGLKSEAADPANVAMVRAQLDQSAFGSLPDSEHTIGAYIRRFKGVLPEGHGDVSVTYEPDHRTLDLATGPYSYTYSVLNPENIRQEPSIPEMDLNFRAELDADLLQEAVEWFDEFTDHVRVGFDPTEQRFWMEGLEEQVGDTGTDDGVFTLDRSELEAVHEVGPADSKYSLDYFKDILSGVPEGQTVELYVGEEFPMKLSYESEHSKVEYMQAPRIGD